MFYQIETNEMKCETSGLIQVFKLPKVMSPSFINVQLLFNKNLSKKIRRVKPKRG